MIATFAPKLNSEMKACIENILTNDKVDPFLKAFCENYLNATNEPIDNRQYVSDVLIGGGLIAMLAMLPTGQIWGLLVMILVTCALVASVSIKQFWSVLEVGERSVLALPSCRDDDIDMVQSDKVVSRVMTNILKIPSEDVAKFEKDPACREMADYVASVVKFQLEYRKVTYMMTGGETTRKVSAVGGGQLPEHLQNLSLQELGERLHDQMAEFSEDWAKSFRTVHSLLNSFEGVQALVDMHGRSNQHATVDEDKMRRKLKLDTFDKAIQTLTSKKAAVLVQDARVFLHNVGRLNPTIAKVHHQLEELNAIQDDVRKLKEDNTKMERELAVKTGEEARLKTQAQNIRAAKSGKKEHLQYLQQTLDAAKANLAAARQDEKSFTYWMFGPLTEIWKNDVKLAKDKVEVYADQEASLAARIESLKDGRDKVVKDLNAEEEANIGNQHQVGKEISDLQQSIQKNKSEMSAADGKAKQLENEINVQLEKDGCVDGCVSVQHLWRANQVLNKFAHCAARASAIEKSMRANWAETLSEIKDLAEFLVETDSFKNQKQLLWQLRKVINSEKVPVLHFIKRACAPSTLAPGPNKTYGLEDAGHCIHSAKEPAKPALLAD